jgi:hypothetical protein
VIGEVSLIWRTVIVLLKLGLPNGMTTYPWMMSLVFTITSKRAMAPGTCLELTAWGNPQVGASKVPHSEGEHGFYPPEGYDAFLMLPPGTGYYMEGNYKLKLDRSSMLYHELNELF